MECLCWPNETPQLPDKRPHELTTITMGGSDAKSSMNGLPVGWDMDYDGRRWFYTYKPTGHIQYHFPNEGDEFPDFFDASTPAPRLAPEERLESQQQMKRHTTHPSDSSFYNNNYNNYNNNDPVKRGGNSLRPQMSAVARPVSNVWEGDGAEEDVFQPENFMYLGPGAYTDVSPLAEEEEEAARRIVAGDGKPPVGVSPEASQRTTPMVKNSEVSPPAALASSPEASEAPAPVIAEPILEVEEEEPEVPMLDGREIIYELPASERFNPVGIMAEMPTEHTAQARIETHPPPVEIGDSSVLAPIEMISAAVPVKSPTTDPKEQRPPAPKGEPKGKEPAHRPDVKDEQTTVAQGSTNAYQPYKPTQGATERVSSPPTSSGKRGSIQREPSLLMRAGAKDASKIDPETVPAALAPQVRASSVSEPMRQGTVSGSSAVEAGKEVPSPPLEKGLSSFPSVLKPARNGHRNSITGPSQGSYAQSPSQTPNPAGAGVPSPPNAGVAKFPSVLKPARGRAPSQTSGAGPEFPQGNVVTTPPVSSRTRSYEAAPPGPQAPVASDHAGSPRNFSPHHQSPGGVPLAGSPGVQVPATQPLASQQPARPASAFPIVQGQPQIPGSGAGGMPQGPPLSSIPAHVAGIPRPASTPAVTPLPQGQPSPRARVLGNKSHTVPGPSIQHVASPPGSLPEASQVRNQPMARAQTTNSSPSAVSSIQSRSSRSDGTPLQSPSPLESMKKAPSSLSLTQSMSSETVFTPSPISSSTPGSAGGGQIHTSPTPARQSGLRNSISGPIPVRAATNTGPPVPGKVPLTQESYFPPQSADQPVKNTAPARPPKQLDQKPQASPEPVTQGAGPGTPGSGHMLNRIEEREEVNGPRGHGSHGGYAGNTGYSRQTNSPPLARRHSVASSIQQSPRLLSRPPTVSSISSMDQSQISSQSNSPPQSQMAPQRQSLPQWQIPPQPQMAPHPHALPPGVNPRQDFGPQHPQAMPQGYGQPSPYPPPNSQQHGYMGHPQQGWHPQMPHPGQQGPQSPYLIQQHQGSSTQKEKEKKWTKWFKNTKATTLSKVPPGQKSPPPSGLPSPPFPISHPIPQGNAHPGMVPNPNLPHGFAPPGQPMMGAYPQDGMPSPGMLPPGAQWVPMPEGFRPGSGHGLGAKQQVASGQRASSYGAPPHGIQPQGPLQGSPAPGRFHPAPSSGRLPHQSTPSISSPVPNPGQAQRPNSTRPDQNPVHPRDALGSHPPNIPPSARNPAQTLKHSHTPSNVSLISQLGDETNPSAKKTTALVPEPLFAKPTSPPAGSTSAPGKGGAQSDKWAKRPVADYSGGDWGEDDNWNQR